MSMILVKTKGMDKPIRARYRRKTKPGELVGQRFGRWTVIAFAGRTKDRQLLWLCRCDCGNEGVVRTYALKKGRSKSCGCLNKEVTSKVKSTHGMSHTKLYRVWRAMINRCTNPNQKSYERYGQRGIRVCDKWLTFEGFLEDMGASYQEGLTLDRIDVNGDYEPSNCRWVSMKKQSNNRRSNHLIEFQGEKMTFSEASERFVIPYHTLKRRLYTGWSVHDALLTPVRGRRSG